MTPQKRHAEHVGAVEYAEERKKMNQHVRNSGHKLVNNQTGYKGVEYRAKKGKYTARIQDNPQGGKRGKFLGWHSTAEAAALAYDAAAIEVWGENAYLNFPSDGQKATTKKETGKCINGHSTAEFEKVNSRGQRICKRCNADACARAYRRRVEKNAGG